MITNLDGSLSTREVKNEKFLEIIQPIADSVRLVGGGIPPEYRDEIHVSEIKRPLENQDRFYIRIIRHFVVQLILAQILFKHRKEYDTVLLFMGYSGPAIMGRLLGKFVVRYHGGPSLSGSYLTNFFMNVLPNIFSNRILVPTKGCIQHFNIGGFKHKIEFAHFHIDNRFETKVPFSERPLSVGFLGHLKESKGTHTVVDAVKLINKRVDETVYLELGGTGPLEKSLNFNYDFIRYHGWVDREETVDFYNSVKLFVLPSQSEGLPTVLIESMACGTPVVATDVGGIPDLVEDGVNGLILHDPNSEQLADELYTLLKTEELIEMHRAASQTIEDTYRISEVQNRFRQVLSH